MHIKTFALNTHDASHKTYPKLPILTFSPSTAPHSSNLIPFSDAYWLPKGLSFVMPRPLIRSLTSFLILCLLAINDEAQQGGQSGFTILAALLSRFCLQIFTGDREQTRTGTGGTFSKKNCSRDYHTKTLASSANPIRFSRTNSPPVSALLFPIVPTIKTFALIFPHPLCNLQLHSPHTLYLTSTFPKPSMMPKVFNPILSPIPKAS